MFRALVSVVKMATVFEEYTTEEQHSFVCFLWEKGLIAMDVNKEMFPVYGGRCLLCKAVHNCFEIFSRGHSKVADDIRPDRPVEVATEATVQ
jgi:hypothetical protein